MLVCGQDLAELNGKELARFRCEHIGAAYSDNGFVPEFSVMENLCLPLIAMEKRESEARERILWLTQKVLPVELLYRRPKHLSLFQRSATSLIRAVSCEPELLILGDLFGNLDERERERLWQLFVSLRPEHSAMILFSGSGVPDALPWTKTLTV